MISLLLLIQSSLAQIVAIPRPRERSSGISVPLAPDVKAATLQVNGFARIFDVQNGVRVAVNLQGLPPNAQVGWHFHATAVVGGDCMSTGPHFNPTNEVHGQLNASPSHSGDLGNLRANANGVAFASVVSTKLNSLATLMGTALVIHQNVDDLGQGQGNSTVNGNSGSRLSCGSVKTSRKRNSLLPSGTSLNGPTVTPTGRSFYASTPAINVNSNSLPVVPM